MAAPFAAVAAAILGIWLATGVGLADALLFAVYQLGFVAAPGWIVWRALLPEDSLVRTLVYGWVLGYALAIGAFVLTAAVDARGAYAFYPLLVAPLLPVALRRTQVRLTHVDVRAAWGVAAVGIAALGYVGLAYFARTPLPWDVARATYETDISFSLSLAGEALHHWPMGDPNVAGEPLYYYVAAHVDLAAASQVTGIALPVVLFRLAIVPLLFLVVAQFVLAGRALTGRVAVGVVAAALYLLVGEVDPEPVVSFPFLGIIFLDVWLSPTFLMGLLFFVPAVTLTVERVRSEESLRTGARRWLVLVVLYAMCATAKPPGLAVLVGGLAVTTAWMWWRQRTVNRNTALALGFASAVFVAFYASIYRHSAFGLGIHPFRTFESMAWVTNLRDSVGDGVGWPLGVVLGTLGLFAAQLAGVVALLVFRRRLDEARTLLAAMLLIGFAGILVFHQPGNSQLYFSNYAVAGGVLLAAEGIVLLASRWPARAALTSAAAVALATVAALGFVTYGVVVRWSAPGPSLPALHLTGVVALGLLVALFVLLWRKGMPNGPALIPALAFVATLGTVLLVWRFGDRDVAAAGFELVAGLVVLTALGLVVTRRSELALALVVLVAAVGVLDLPLDYAPTLVDRARSGAPLANAGDTGINRGLYAGLAWIRANTSPRDVLAVNNTEERQGEFRLPIYFYYAAFAERRVFLEGWLFTAKAWNERGNVLRGTLPDAFPRRTALNDAVFERGDRAALDTLVRDYGVRYLVDDKLQGSGGARLRTLGRLVFSNPAVAVYRVS